MNQANLLITGSNGQLGKALCEYYPEARRVDADQLNIADEKAVSSFDWTNITTILNAAAYTNVDGAETSEGRIAAWQVNAIGPRNLAHVALKRNLTLVHISTDYVFDGYQANHSEDESFSPLGVYGQSKAAGDIAASLLLSHYILRTSWVIGDGKNFVRTMLDLGKRGISPSVVSDQIGRLTFTGELVRAIDHLLKQEAPSGTYNVTNGGDPASWANIAREIFRAANLDITVTNTTTAEYFANKPGIAPRPLQSTLDLAKITGTGFVSRDWREDLAIYSKKESRT